MYSVTLTLANTTARTSSASSIAEEGERSFAPNSCWKITGLPDGGPNEPKVRRDWTVEGNSRNE